MFEGLRNLYAVDDGNRNIKLICNGRKLCIPSRIQVGSLPLINVGGGPVKGNYEYTIERNGERHVFSIGNELTNSVHVATDDYCFSDYNRVLVYHALRDAGAKGEVDIVTGLPLKQFYRGRSGQVNGDLLMKKEASLTQNDIYISEFENLTKLGFTVASNDTLAEAIASWLDVVTELDEVGGVSYDDDLTNKNIAVVDIGGRTIDITVIKDYNINAERSTTVDLGMLEVRDQLKDVLFDMCGEEFPIPYLDRAIETKTIEQFGDIIDISEDLERIHKELSQRVATEITRVLGKGSDLARIAFAGGGSVDLYQKFLAELYPRNGKLTDDPLFTNAMGMYKFGILSMAANV